MSAQPAPVPPGLSPVESAKRLAAYAAVDTHFPRDPLPRAIGIGSGSTVVYVVERIAQLDRSITSKILFVPTGYQSRQLILSAGLPLGDIDLIPDETGSSQGGGMMEVAFDGADEVDKSMNCIKGGGACLFQEKLVAIKAKKFVVVADFRKISQSLSTMYAPGIPIEVVPPAAGYVLKRVQELGSIAPTLRMGGTAKAGPCVTDNGNFIIDAPFPNGVVFTQEEGAAGEVAGAGVGGNDRVERLATTLKGIVGVVEHGIFWVGDKKPVIAYFGMSTGEVEMRTL